LARLFAICCPDPDRVHVRPRRDGRGTFLPRPGGSPMTAVPSSPRRRILSLDQFRGYTVAGMLLVNFLGGYHLVPAILKHHNTYCSYADTIMPQFFFAVGFAYRMTFLRRLQTAGAGAAIRAVLRRNA